MLGDRNDLYFNLRTPRQRHHLNGRARREGRMKIFRIDGVHIGKVGQIRHEHGGLYHVRIVHSVGAEHSPDILKQIRRGYVPRDPRNQVQEPK